MVDETEKTFLITEDMLANGNWEYLCCNFDYNEMFYKLGYKKKQYLVQRIGECNPKKCKSACCKFKSDNFLSENQVKYHSGFGIKSKFDGVVNYNIVCNKLNCKEDICKVWKTEDFPVACSQFPHPQDSIYWEIHEKCSFKFQIINELSNIKKVV